MQARFNTHQFVQVFFIVCLMAIIAWLATWQETPPVQLSAEQNIQLDSRPWSEEHLILPVSTSVQYYPASEHAQVM